MKKKNNSLIAGGFAHSKIQLDDITVTTFADSLPIIKRNFNGQLINCISANALHNVLGVDTRLTDWIKRRINEYGFIQGVDYLLVETLSDSNLSSTKSRQQIKHEYLVTFNMAKELGMVERTEQGRLIRQYFIKCEEALHNETPTITKQLRQQLKSRLKVASYFKPMCSALDLARMEQGKNTLPRHYTIESNMLNRIVFGGLTAKAWTKQNGIIGNTRDSMNETQLEHLSYLEQTNTTLIELGMDYHTRKNKLVSLSQKWLAQRVEERQL
ncbi:antA/AntB antirepressor family protein [Providencia rettgeri]|uniref:antA/AntB antirepressor family protein n=1 Tax=Providencia rettgeri TaxID=587 RepID=UPI00069E5222|nr:antA/AntB antirepressor family protein [Providencia rettgeri]